MKMKNLALMACAAMCCAAIFVACNQGQNGQQSSSALTQQEQTLTRPDSAAMAVAGDDAKKANLDQLPKAAKAVLEKTFAGKEVARVSSDNDDFTVYYNTGEKVEFDKQGGFKEVEFAGGVPASLVPEKIKTAVEAAFAGATIVKLDKNDDGGYEVKLNNGKEIDFDSAFKQLKVSD